MHITMCKTRAEAVIFKSMKSISWIQSCYTVFWLPTARSPPSRRVVHQYTVHFDPGNKRVQKTSRYPITASCNWTKRGQSINKSRWICI